MNDLRKESYVVILVTLPSKKKAEALAQRLVKKKLAACVNIIAGINSIFRWKGKLDRCKEALLLIKTRKTLFSEVEDVVESLSSYEIPEVIALPIIEGKAGYLRWIKSVTARTSSV